MRPLDTVVRRPGAAKGRSGARIGQYVARRRRPPWRAAQAAFGLLLGTLLFPCAGHAGNSLEYAVKATYLYKFAAFVNWPPGALPDHAFVICVVGDDPFGPVLDQAVAGQLVQQRPAIVRRYRTISSNPGCQLLFAAGSQAQTVAGVLAALRGAPVLTVTDGQSDTDVAGMINFVLENGYVRFEIDPHMATDAGLAISSKLLSLAVRLRGASAS